jgi:hypothetical protein
MKRAHSPGSARSQTITNSEELMMFNYGYTCYQAERAKTQAEQREADAQLGQVIAALAQLLGSLAKPVRALRRHSGTGRSAGEHARQPAAGAIWRDADIDPQHDRRARDCSSERGTAPGEPGVSGPQRRPLAVG